MRATFVTTDVLTAAKNGLDQLQRLSGAGLKVMLLRSRPSDEADSPLDSPYPLIQCAPTDVFCRDDLPDLLMQAVSAADVSMSEVFLVCREREDVTLAIVAGCRPVVVLGERGLDEFIGPQEPDEKSFAVAPALETAVDFMLEEAEHEAVLGPFPYAPHHSLEDLPRPPVMRRSDIVKIMAVVVVAGVAMALGIAYLLQEIYQTYHFPRVAYYLTLQFIEQKWRGILFLLMGAATALVAQRFINRVNARRRTG